MKRDIESLQRSVTDLRQRISKTALRWFDCSTVLKESVQGNPKYIVTFIEKNKDLLLRDHSASLIEAEKVVAREQFGEVDRSQEKLVLTEEWRKMVKYYEDVSSLRVIGSPNLPGSASSYTGDDINETVPKFSSTRALGLSNFHSPGREIPELSDQEVLKHLRLKLQILEAENQTLKSAMRQQQLSNSPIVSPVLRPAPRKSMLRTSEPPDRLHITPHPAIHPPPQSDQLSLLLLQAATIEHLLRECNVNGSKSRTEDHGSCS